MKFERELSGAWEERGVIGSRIEIEKNELVILWRGGVVLKTKFKASEDEDGKITLTLHENKLRYAGSYSSYASVSRLQYFDKKLEFEETFPITGKSICVLEKTNNTRYGNYDIVDGAVLKSLCGEWKSQDGYQTLVFDKDTLIVNGEKRKIHVLKSRDENARGYMIADADPSADYIGGLYRITYLGSHIEATIHVCDAPSIGIKFERTE